MQVIKWSLENKCKIWVVSPTYSQSRKFYKDIFIPMAKTGLVKNHTEGMGAVLIEFFNGSIIEFKSAASRDSLRGATIDYLVIDEGAFISEDIINEVLLPMLLTKDKMKVLVVTTPKGKNWVYKWFIKNEPGYHSIKFTSADNPMANKELIDEMRLMMPSALFEQEYLAEFIDSASIFSNVDDICSLDPQPYNGSLKYFVGVDIGMKADNTVISVFNNKKEMVDIIILSNKETYEIKQAIMDINIKYKPIKIYIEQNNQGLPIISDLLNVNKLYNIIAFVTTNQSKGEIINELTYSMNMGEVKLLNSEILRSEMKAFISTKTPNGATQYFASYGHDDTVMATAIAYRCLNKHINESNGSFIIR